ncbi:MAG: transposase [Candidatus Omnitrophota bacterium]|mgnify:FL=1
MNNRRSNRLPRYDYSQDGYYFVTVCTKDKYEWFGRVKNDVMVLNEYGKIVSKYWHDLPNHYRNVKLDESIIMPNHIHGIIAISDAVGTEQCSVPTKRVSLSQIVKSFKNVTTKRIRSELGDIRFLWQRSFYDHVIRGEKELMEIREYVLNNPKKWDMDIENVGHRHACALR